MTTIRLKDGSTVDSDLSPSRVAKHRRRGTLIPARDGDRDILVMPSAVVWVTDCAGFSVDRIAAGSWPKPNPKIRFSPAADVQTGDVVVPSTGSYRGEPCRVHFCYRRGASTTFILFPIHRPHKNWTVESTSSVRVVGYVGEWEVA